MPSLPRIFTPRRRPDEPALAGPLAILFWCACGITAVPLAGIFSLIAALGPAGAVSAVVDSLSGQSMAAQILRLGLIPQLALFLWSLSFVILTVQRSAHALTVSPWLLATWAVVTALCQFGIRNAMAVDGLTVGDLAALLPGILVQTAGAAAFWGYLREGERPRRYFSRGAAVRVPTPKA